MAVTGVYIMKGRRRSVMSVGMMNETGRRAHTYIYITSKSRFRSPGNLSIYTYIYTYHIAVLIRILEVRLMAMKFVR